MTTTEKASSTLLSRTAVIPAHNEAATIAEVVTRTIPYVDEVIVVDDGSTDETGDEAYRAGASEVVPVV